MRSLALALAAPSVAHAEQKVGVVDVQRAVMQTEDGLRATATLKKLLGPIAYSNVWTSIARSSGIAAVCADAIAGTIKHPTANAVPTPRGLRIARHCTPVDAPKAAPGRRTQKG